MTTHALDDRAPADPGHGTDLGEEEPGGRGGDRGPRPGQPGVRDEEQQTEAGGTDERLGREDAALPEPVGQAAPDRCADGVGDGQGTGARTARPVAAGRVRHEEEGAELAHGEREAGHERDDDIGGTGQAEKASVGLEG